MPLFSAKLDYALRAVLDLAMQPAHIACQSREIAARQDIRGPYLDQILAVLKREGIVRSIRGAGGGYTLARGASRITVADVVRAVAGTDLLASPSIGSTDPATSSTAYVVRQYAERAEAELCRLLRETTLADLVTQKQRLDDSYSIMPGI
ncbi:MAG: Rrf2 family transcriptional regulator [Chthonomonadales bacterium]|nr:Rrf2 family transcriptional regulator [Chthonomonadales bacterium]